jgi:hypothetical protein
MQVIKILKRNIYSAISIIWVILFIVLIWPTRQKPLPPQELTGEQQLNNDNVTRILSAPYEQHTILSPRHGYGTGEYCRNNALRTLTTTPADDNVTASQLLEAKRCWQDALVFYLSYPIDVTSGSHAIPLLASLWVSDGPILELGCGWYSTPVVHRISAVQDRKVLTADSVYAWLSYFLFFASDKHELCLVNDNDTPVKNVNDNVHVVRSWDAIGREQPNWGVVIVDHQPADQRAVDLLRLRDHVDLFLVHDTEPKQNIVYKLERHLETFTYRTVFGPDWSSIFADVVSDTRPELIRAVQMLCEWSIEVLKQTKEQ